MQLFSHSCVLGVSHIENSQTWPLEFTTLSKWFFVSTFLPSFPFFFHRKLPLIAIKVTFAPYRFLATTRKNDINRNFTLN